MSERDFYRIFWERHESLWNLKVPKALEDAFLADDDPALNRIQEAIRAFRSAQASRWEQELFKQVKRRADAERALTTKVTRKAQEDLRISTSKVGQLKRWLDDLRRQDTHAGDARIYPGWYAPVMVEEGGQRVVLPMRYQCRLPGWTEAVERKYPGTYNARRDKLEKAWGKVFGYTHGIMLATAFYEHVDRDGQDVVLEFRPDTGQEMLVACLWTRTRNKDGSELLSFAAVTDEPPAEVAAAGHDRCIIPLREENVDAWLRPDPANLAAQYALLDDRERPYYEHRLAA